MLVSLLSCGPSLCAFDDARRGDLVIGVNGAACRHACDWWSIGDDQTILRHSLDADEPVVGRPHVSTMSPSMHRIKESYPAVHANRDWITWEQLRDSVSAPQSGWDQWSAPAALVLAVHLGATTIAVFGVDMIGSADFAGRDHKRFNEHRWVRERRSWDSALTLCGAAGVTVHRSPLSEEVAT